LSQGELRELEPREEIFHLPFIIYHFSLSGIFMTDPASRDLLESGFQMENEK
jgi:hypothetical protein